VDSRTRLLERAANAGDERALEQLWARRLSGWDLADLATQANVRDPDNPTGRMVALPLDRLTGMETYCHGLLTVRRATANPRDPWRRAMGYMVCHVPSGYSIRLLRTKGSARKLAKELSTWGALWASANATVLCDLLKSRVLPILSSYPRHYV